MNYGILHKNEKVVEKRREGKDIENKLNEKHLDQHSQKKKLFYSIYELNNKENDTNDNVSKNVSINNFLSTQINDINGRNNEYYSERKNNLHDTNNDKLLINKINLKDNKNELLTNENNVYNLHNNNYFLINENNLNKANNLYSNENINVNNDSIENKNNYNNLNYSYMNKNNSNKLNNDTILNENALNQVNQSSFANENILNNVNNIDEISNMHEINKIDKKDNIDKIKNIEILHNNMHNVNNDYPNFNLHHLNKLEKSFLNEHNLMNGDILNVKYTEPFNINDKEKDTPNIENENIENFFLNVNSEENNEVIKKNIKKKIDENDHLFHAINELLELGLKNECIPLFERLQQNLFFLVMLANIPKEIFDDLDSNSSDY